MPLRVCANLTKLFVETSSLAERYRLAAKAGFRAVEVAFPYEVSAGELARAKAEAGVEQVLINAFPGDTSGLAALAKEQEFLQSMKKSLEYCKALDCKR